MNLRPIQKNDISACAALYNYYVENTVFSFETSPVSVEEFGERAARITADYPYLVAEEQGEITGFCYLDKFSPRGGYHITCDLSVYVKNDCRGRGIGRALVNRILAEARERGFANVMALISSENEGSARFHAKMGFEPIALLPDIGEKFGKLLGLQYFVYRLGKG